MDDHATLRSHTAFLDELLIKVTALEKLFGALPGAAEVDLEPIRRSLQVRFSGGISDIVSEKHRFGVIDETLESVQRYIEEAKAARRDRDLED